jgi:hypothetical protein
LCVIFLTGKGEKGNSCRDNAGMSVETKGGHGGASRKLMFIRQGEWNFEEVRYPTGAFAVEIEGNSETRECCEITEWRLL